MQTTSKPWIIIFNWNDPLGKIYLDQDEYEKILKAIERGLEQLVLNGRVVPLRFATVRENPDYVDQDKVAKLREIIEKQKEETRKKYE